MQEPSGYLISFFATLHSPTETINNLINYEGSGQFSGLDIL